MKKTKKGKESSPIKSLNYFLIFLIVLSFGGIISIVYLAYTNLTSTADQANQAISKIQQENAPLENTDQIIAQNAKFADILQIVPRLSAPAADVQPVLTNDINKYARLTGIRISSTTYGKEAAATGSATGGQIPSNPSQSSSDEADSGANTIKIEAGNAVPMRSILQFIKLIENNLPVMYLTEISLDSTNTNDVKISSMTIGVQTQ